MTKIVVDLEKMKHLHSGLGQFCKHLSDSLCRANKGFDFFWYGDKEVLNDEQEKNNIPWSRWHQLTGVDTDALIWHCTHQEARYLPKTGEAKIVLTIHDLNFLDQYQGYKRHLHLSRLQKLVNRASAVVFISEYTKRVANKYLKIKSLQFVIYNGLAIDTEIEPAKPKEIIDSVPFLFSIGVFTKKKNFHTLIVMMHQFPEMKLYLAGNSKTSYGKEIQRMIDDEHLNDRIVLLGEVTEGKKKWMYQNMACFVFPSLQEGFGLPVVEAMHYGAPIVISNTTALPEIGGDVVHYFDSFDPLKMSEKLKLAMMQPIDPDRIKRRAERFSWQKAGANYISVYKELLSR